MFDIAQNPMSPYGVERDNTALNLGKKISADLQNSLILPNLMTIKLFDHELFEFYII